MNSFIVYPLDGDTSVPVLCSVAEGTDMGTFVTSLVGAGNPYYAFETLPSSITTADELGADFTGAPIAATPPGGDWADAAFLQANRNNVLAQYANPVSVGSTNNGTNKVWRVS